MAVLFPLPLTPFYNELLENGYYTEDHWDKFFRNPTPNYNLPLCRSADLQEELWGMVDTANKKFYLSPKFIVEDLKRNTSFKMLLLKAQLAFKLIFASASYEQLSWKNKPDPVES